MVIAKCGRCNWVSALPSKRSRQLRTLSGGAKGSPRFSDAKCFRSPPLYPGPPGKFFRTNTAGNGTMKKKVVGLGEVLWDLLPERTCLGGAPANFAYITTLMGDQGIVASRVGEDSPGVGSTAAHGGIGPRHRSRAD